MIGDKTVRAAHAQDQGFPLWPQSAERQRTGTMIEKVKSGTAPVVRTNAKQCPSLMKFGILFLLPFIFSPFLVPTESSL